MTLSDRTVAVVGGGIGGLAVATALAQRGARVTVCERAPALTEVGAGLQVSVNGQRVLRALGAVDAPPDMATVSQGTLFRDGSTDRRVAHVPSPGVGPTWYLHRADLLDLLQRAALAAGVEVVLGQPRVPGTLEADLIVAADGGRSTWRDTIDGPDRPKFTGQVAWRALVPCTQGDLPCTQGDLPDMAQLYMGTRAHVVLYPLRQGRLANLVAIEERHGWLEEGWMRRGDPDEFRARFGDFEGDAGRMIAQVREVHSWALHLRPVANRWHSENTVLLGDAAHPTLPFLAQGACLALEDALVLANVLAASDDIAEGLSRYQALRQGRAARIVAIARGNAWRFHMAKPWAWGAHLALKLGAAQLATRLEWVYDYDAGSTPPVA